ncbi:hypothetical protein C2857_007591 [Epichloe festucae Fl1]|uniref:Glycosyl hydrolase n=1 Tax=Epichloe festucae (strain Fl1) TaxID=877507 RepID=A0A7S9KMP1_EPIFF|nr:hypothetical protein C2857_007591 [Epichloe festucae Fl1]
MRRHHFLAGLSAFASLASSTAPSINPPKQVAPCSVFQQQAPYDCRPVSKDIVHVRNEVPPGGGSGDLATLEDVFNALAVLQNTYFDSVNGTWPKSIDWTGAVVGTIISGTLSTLTKSPESVQRDRDWNQKEQLISSIFAQVAHSFFGQNAVAILGEAYDDILWVVLGWLETIKFIHLHSTLHHPERAESCLSVPTTLDSAIRTVSWHGNHWVCTFAQRARTFWDAASEGWDTKLCHGGMNWNPRLEPYKNAITNELWISASISMYEHFPDDRFNQSWAVSKGFSANEPATNDPATNDPAYLAAAIVGYKWLKDVNMTNSQGLYVDGFHVDKSKPGNVECDERDEMVYTYNQGVVLSGQRGLFTVTGSPSYLEDGHTLVQNVIKATGWDLGRNVPTDHVGKARRQGLGRYGILEEHCDASGTCSQDSQTFKGIFFHHLTAFCAPLEASELERHANFNINRTEPNKVRAAHGKACLAYVGWVKHNVDAALRTRDAAGRFGMWWGASSISQGSQGLAASLLAPVPPLDSTTSTTRTNSTDYRNKGTPLDRTWGLGQSWQPGSRTLVGSCQDLPSRPGPGPMLRVADDDDDHHAQQGPHQSFSKDANDRGRGRTVETQAGGLALLRAYWELSRSR